MQLGEVAESLPSIVDHRVITRVLPETFADLLAEIAMQKSVTPAQIALAWLLTEKPWIVQSQEQPNSHAWKRTGGYAFSFLKLRGFRKVSDGRHSLPNTH
jgi:hypothetical protein